MRSPRGDPARCRAAARSWCSSAPSGQALQLVSAQVDYGQDVPAFEPAVGGSVGVANDGLTVAEIALVSDELRATFDALPPRNEETPTPSVEVVTTLTISASTASGETVHTAPASFPLTVCKGCLLEYPAEASLPGASPNCRNDELSAPETPCRVGQDDPVDCRTCRERKPIALRPECEPF